MEAETTPSDCGMLALVRSNTSLLDIRMMSIACRFLWMVKGDKRGTDTILYMGYFNIRTGYRGTHSRCQW